MNPNDAELVRIYTASLSGFPDQTPITGTTPNTDVQFKVIVEGEAGEVLGQSGQPYDLTIQALDITNGTNPGASFTQAAPGAFMAPNWPNYKNEFTVTILAADVPAINGHLLRYYAVLTSANQIDSFVESPLFLLQQ